MSQKIDWQTITPEELSELMGYGVAKAKEQIAIVRGQWRRDVVEPDEADGGSNASSASD